MFSRNGQLCTLESDSFYIKINVAWNIRRLHCLHLPQPLCPKELWHFVHQCYGNELGLTSDDEDYVPPDDDFNTMG